MLGAMPEAALELVEPRHSGEGVAQDEDAPPFADPFEAAGDRAIHAAESWFMAHFAVSRNLLS